MSAICGIVHLDGRPVNRMDLERMVASSPHRGPDGVRYHVEDNAGFAHLAFSVTPESALERQPILDKDGSTLLVADVRLDNRSDLAREMGVPQRRLAELTDPDLLMLAYQAWGDDCPSHLLGDFVFAVWRPREQKLLVARDALGGFSLSYIHEDASLYFASETTALLDSQAIDVQINDDAVAKTLAGMSLDANETYFRSVHYLAPAHCLTFAFNAFRIRRYWNIDPELQIRYRAEDDYTDHFTELLNQAVACRTQVDHSIGISLSGGHDSTLLAAVAAVQLAGKGLSLKSFSYVFDRYGECDERHYMEPVIERYGIEPHFIKADDLWTFRNLSPNEIPRDYLWTNAFLQLPQSVADAAGNSGCRLLIDGMVGDVLFGEPSLIAAELMYRGQLGRLFSLFIKHSGKIDARRDLFLHGLRQLIPPGWRRWYRHWRPADPRALAPGLSDKWSKRIVELRERYQEPAAGLGLSPGRRTRYNRIFQTMWAQGMAATRCNPYNRAGLERYSPYFDRRLVEFVLAIPCEQLSHPGRPRKLQKNVMRRLLPTRVWQRQGKTGFLPLMREGLLNRERYTVLKPAQTAQIVQAGWIRDAWLQEQLMSADAVEKDDFYLSVCLHLELWLRCIEPALHNRERWAAPCLQAARRERICPGTVRV
jgi:asparagine synthase (glutamine-hydrolysing)